MKLFKRPLYRREIAVVILVKVLVLTAIWYFFFKDPLQDHLNDQVMGSHFVGHSVHGAQFG